MEPRGWSCLLWCRHDFNKEHQKLSDRLITLGELTELERLIKSELYTRNMFGVVSLVTFNCSSRRAQVYHKTMYLLPLLLKVECDPTRGLFSRLSARPYIHEVLTPCRPGDVSAEVKGPVSWYSIYPSYMTWIFPCEYSVLWG